MALSTSSVFFTSLNLNLNSHKRSPSSSRSVRFRRAWVSAALATAEMTGNASFSSLYEVLGVGVGVGAGTLLVKAGYRRLGRVLHPDVGTCESSADEFMKVHLVYTTLVDPEKRAEYDRSLVQRRSRVSSPMTFACGFPSRRWETDQCW